MLYLWSEVFSKEEVALQSLRELAHNFHKIPDRPEYVAPQSEGPHLIIPSSSHR